MKNPDQIFYRKYLTLFLASKIYQLYQFYAYLYQHRLIFLFFTIRNCLDFEINNWLMEYFILLALMFVIIKTFISILLNFSNLSSRSSFFIPENIKNYLKVVLSDARESREQSYWCYKNYGLRSLRHFENFLLKSNFFTFLKFHEVLLNLLHQSFRF